MVTINLTLLIELGLFLLFLWVTNRFILAPTLRLLDEREHMIQHNEESTERDQSEATALEQQYHSELVGVRRAAEERFREARRTAMDQRAKTLAQERESVEGEIRAVRKSANEKVAAQRDEALALAPKLAEDIARQLGLSEVSS